VYDLQAFSAVHPGGASKSTKFAEFLPLCSNACTYIIANGGAGALNIFGGSDATTHYYMLHPHQQLRQVSSVTLQSKHKTQVTVFARPLDPNFATDTSHVRGAHQGVSVRACSLAAL
jgi:hypothetical protein